MPALEDLPQKAHINNRGDKYWITFSQWLKSSGAAGFGGCPRRRLDSSNGCRCGHTVRPWWGHCPPYSSPRSVRLATSEAIRSSLSAALLYLTSNQLTSSIVVLTVYRGVEGEHHYLPPDALLSPRMQRSGRWRGQRLRCPQSFFTFVLIKKAQFIWLNDNKWENLIDNGSGRGKKFHLWCDAKHRSSRLQLSSAGFWRHSTASDLAALR